MKIHWPQDVPYACQHSHLLHIWLSRPIYNELSLVAWEEEWDLVCDYSTRKSTTLSWKHLVRVSQQHMKIIMHHLKWHDSKKRHKLFVTEYGEGQRKNSWNQLAHIHTCQDSFTWKGSSSNVVLDEVVPIKNSHVLLVLMEYFILVDFHLQNFHHIHYTKEKMLAWSTPLLAWKYVRGEGDNVGLEHSSKWRNLRNKTCFDIE